MALAFERTNRRADNQLYVCTRRVTEGGCAAVTEEVEESFFDLGSVYNW
jgi:hypothetical protein